MKEGNKRKTGKEQYYTQLDIADSCVKKMLGFVGIDRMFLEPCGGRGDFIEAMLRNGIPETNIISFDIEPHHYLVKEANFLNISAIELPYTNLITLTNPPFGRANSLSKKFFNKAAQFSEYIGFIVPKSWRKWSVWNSLDNKFHLIFDEDLPNICFYSPATGSFDNGNLDCVFQIWHRENTVRRKVRVRDHGLIKKVQSDEADVALVVFGWQCGKLLRDFERVANTTLMFLKVRDDAVIDALEKLDYKVFYDNVAYTQALSLSEINYLLNEYFGLDQKAMEDVKAEEVEDLFK